MCFPIIHRDRQRDGSAFLTVPSGQAAWVNQQGSVQQLAQITLHNQRDQPVNQTNQKPISLHPQIQDMSVKYKIRDQHGLNYLTCSVTGWVDLFARQAYRDIRLAWCSETSLAPLAYLGVITKINKREPPSEKHRTK